jgi:hypothetical protein
MINWNNFNSILSIEFNIKKLIEFTSADKEIILSTLNILEETLDSDLNLMIKNTYSFDVVSLKKIAHKMKPNFDLIGLESLFDLCNNIESGNLSNDELIQGTKLIYETKSTLINLLKEEKIKIEIE